MITNTTLHLPVGTTLIRFDYRLNGNSFTPKPEEVELSLQECMGVAPGEFGSVDLTPEGWVYTMGKPGATGDLIARYEDEDGRKYEGGTWIALAGQDMRGKCSSAIHITMTAVVEGALVSGAGNAIEQAPDPANAANYAPYYLFEMLVAEDFSMEWLTAFQDLATQPANVAENASFQIHGNPEFIALKPGERVLEVHHNGLVVGRIIANTDRGLADVRDMCEKILEKVGMPGQEATTPFEPRITVYMIGCPPPVVQALHDELGNEFDPVASGGYELGFEHWDDSGLPETPDGSTNLKLGDVPVVLSANWDSNPDHTKELLNILEVQVRHALHKIGWPPSDEAKASTAKPRGGQFGRRQAKAK